MRNIMLAIAAVALAALAPFALAAEGQGDNGSGKQPTMAELASKVDSLGTRLGGMEATLGNLATATVGTSATSIASKVDALSSTVSANHTTIVGKFARQMAVVMSVPQWLSRFNGLASTDPGYFAQPHYLIGESTIPGFPAGTVGANGSFTDATLPAGTYLFELQQPYGDNTICQRAISRRFLRGTSAAERHVAACPRVRLHPFSGSGTRDSTRLEDGYGIYTYAAPASFQLRHKWPPGLKFSEDTTLSATERANAKSFASYSGAVRITKLK